MRNLVSRTSWWDTSRCSPRIPNRLQSTALNCACRLYSSVTHAPMRGAGTVSTGGSTLISAASLPRPLRWSILAADARSPLIRRCTWGENCVQTSCTATRTCSTGAGALEEQRVLSDQPDYEGFVSGLENRTHRVLLESPQLSPSVLRVKIIRLIWDWGQLWGHARLTPPAYIGRGAILTEKLIHVLLDAKEEEMNNKSSDVGGTMKTRFEPLCLVAINGLAKSDLAERGRRAQSILDRVENIFAVSGGQEGLAPTSKMYNATISAYSKSDEVAATDSCVSLLRRMDDRFCSGDNTLVEPNAVAYNSVLDAFARRGDAQNAQLLVEEMERLFARSNDELMMPDAFSFSSLIHAWEKSCHPHAAKKAEETLQRMMDLFNATGDRRLIPNQVTFGVSMALYANNPNEREGAANAERILDWLIELYRKTDCDKDLSPNASHFVTVMHGYANSRGRLSATRAESILMKMEDLYSETGCNSIKPNHKCFVICIKAWVRSKHRNAAKNAERLLNRMESLFLDAFNPSERMNNYSFNIVTDCWARSGGKGSSERIESIIEHMEQIARETDNDTIAPDKFTYTSLLRALVNERVSDYLQKCASVLQRMESLAESGSLSMKPDAIAYSMLLNGHAREGNATEVEALIQYMKEKEIQPTTVMFNIFLNAIVRSKEQDAAARAEKILRRMEREYGSGNEHCKPSIVSYITCINALARSRDKDRLSRARNLYNEVVRHYRGGNNDFKPDLSVFGSLLTVIARSNYRDKVAQALDVISHLQDYGLSPNRVIYNIVLSACAQTLYGGAKEDQDTCQNVLQVAVSIFRLLRSDKSLGGADSNSYKALLHVAHNLILDETDRLASIEDLFRKCCEDGQVNQWVLQSLLQVTPGPHFWRLVQKDSSHGIVKVGDLPVEWSRNAERRKWHMFQEK